MNKGLNVLIGENNSGKTAIIDVLHLVFEEANNPREIYWRESDFRIESDEEIKPIEIDISFKYTEKLELAWFNELHYVEMDENNNPIHYLDLHFKIELNKNNSVKKFKRKIWGGKDIENKVSFEVLAALNSIYLSPLRDVNQDFKPNNRNMLGKLFSNILIDEDSEKDKFEKEKLTDLFEENFKNEDWIDFIEKGKNQIFSHLKEMGFSNDSQNIYINFSSFKFEGIVKKLILQIPLDFKGSMDSESIQTKYFDLYQNGLGYNNLIYTATVLGDIIQRNNVFKEEYNILLIEEPEAHLHPQLESTFFKYLTKLDQNEEFQIIVSSHSPTITAKTKLNNVTVLQNVNNEILATAIKDTPLSEDNRIFLKKFLDVTKSQLFFSKGVILVEGITEALLLPTFAKLLNYNLEKNGIEVIVTGTSFSHYANLFNSDDEKERLSFRCSILTDDDRNKEGGHSRIKNLKEIEKNNLKIFLAENTFEYELGESNLDKNDVITDVFDEVHSKIRNNLKEEKEFTSDVFVDKLANNNSKSEFAYKLSEFLESKLKENSNYDEFVVPNYIKEGIEFVLGEDNAH